MIYKPSQRNWDNVQFEKLRKTVDVKFNEVHDELSECYYDKKPFRNYGILDKETFDKLHGLIFQMREIKFHEENLKQPIADKIPEEKYNDIADENENVIGKKNVEIAKQIVELKKQGIELKV